SAGSLRRALTDPARPGTDKSALVRSLFSELDERVQDALASFVNQRWSGEHDLSQSIEDAGVTALLAYAQSADQLESVEEELFRVERLLASERELLVAIGNRAATKATRLELLQNVLGGKLSPVAHDLLARAVGVPRGGRLIARIQHIVEQAAHRRERTIARVSAAVELSAAQRKRLESILEKAYGHKVQINAAIDPTVIGGIRVQVGAEVVVGTVLTRPYDARRRLIASSQQ